MLHDKGTLAFINDENSCFNRPYEETNQEQYILRSTFRLIIPSLKIHKILNFELDFNGYSRDGFEPILRMTEESVNYLKSKKLHTKLYVGLEIPAVLKKGYYDKLTITKINKVDDEIEVPLELVEYDSYFSPKCQIYLRIVFLNEFKQSFQTKSALWDFANFFQEKKFTDVTIKCKGGDLQCHKAFICARSLVFERMFSNETLESRTGIVQCDFDLHVMEALLEYIYFDKVPKSNLKKLHEAADYYDLPYFGVKGEDHMIHDCTD